MDDPTLCKAPNNTEEFKLDLIARNSNGIQSELTVYGQSDYGHLLFMGFVNNNTAELYSISKQRHSHTRL